MRADGIGHHAERIAPDVIGNVFAELAGRRQGIGELGHERILRLDIADRGSQSAWLTTRSSIARSSSWQSTRIELDVLEDVGMVAGHLLHQLAGRCSPL